MEEVAFAVAAHHNASRREIKAQTHLNTTIFSCNLHWVKI